jgi:hypothetical protein
VPRGAALRGLEARGGAAARGCGRGLAPGAGTPGLRPGRLGGPRGRRPGRSPPRPRRLPEPEQEGRAGPQLRALRQADVGGERDAPRGRRHPRQRLPRGPAPAEAALLTEDRDARPALPEVLPHSQDTGGRGRRVRVSVRAAGRGGAAAGSRGQPSPTPGRWDAGVGWRGGRRGLAPSVIQRWPSVADFIIGR